MPVRRAAIEAPESRATTPSMPVPTNGASARTSGTAWRCMLEPINARLASSFSRNGISAAATDTSCFGDAAVLDLAIGRLDEAVLVHPRIGGERVDEADVGTFRGLDWADAPVMGRVHVAHLEAGAF